MSRELLLEGRRLAVGYGARVVGRDLDVAVGAGEVIALLGPNGGGKTTLLKTLLGLVPPLAGDVRVEGRPLAEIGLAERARLLAYVPQAHAGVFAFTALEVVLTGRGARGGFLGRPGPRDRTVAAACLERLGVAHLAERAYTRISGGERQLVLIARALAQEPRVVILDEPTASLDFGNHGRVMGEIGRLTAAGLGVVFSTHDPNHALRYANRALLMRDGGLLSSGIAVEVLTGPTLEYLYGAPVRVIETTSDTAFLPGP